MDKRASSIIKLIVPSALGIMLFLIPVNYNGGKEIVIGILCSRLKAAMGSALIPTLVCIIVISAVLTLWHGLSPIGFISKNKRLNEMFSAGKFWTAVRVIGAVIAVMVYFRLGSEIICSDDTGGNMLRSILPTCAVWYFLGGLLLPLLMDYGCIDIVGTFFRKSAYLLFRVPGRAMIDCISSWIGSSVCGTYLTISQYEGGFYTAREAVTIISNFSMLSISFCSLIASMLGLDGMFGKFYGTIVIAGIICAVIMPRLWPINRIPDEYNSEVGKQINEKQPENMSSLRFGWEQALNRAANAPGPVGMLENGLVSSVNLMVTSMPAIMAFGTAALIVANYTNVFDYIGAPLGLYLKLFGVQDAMAVGSVMLVGFADQFVPVILGAAMTSVSVRFLIGTISVLQILYITDVGTLIMTSKVPFKLWQMFVVFLERVVICIPIVIACEHIFGIV